MRPGHVFANVGNTLLLTSRPPAPAAAALGPPKDSSPGSPAAAPLPGPALPPPPLAPIGERCARQPARVWAHLPSECGARGLQCSLSLQSSSAWTLPCPNTLSLGGPAAAACRLARLLGYDRSLGSAVYLLLWTAALKGRCIAWDVATVWGARILTGCRRMTEGRCMRTGRGPGVADEHRQAGGQRVPRAEGPVARPLRRVRPPGRLCACHLGSARARNRTRVSGQLGYRRARVQHVERRPKITLPRS